MRGATGVDTITQVLVEAVNRTRLLGNTELLVDVLLSLVLSTRQLDQQRLVPLLHSALALLADGDSACRAKASATLALLQRASTDLPQLLQVVDDTLNVANRTGDAAARYPHRLWDTAMHSMHC